MCYILVFKLKNLQKMSYLKGKKAIFLIRIMDFYILKPKIFP